MEEHINFRETASPVNVTAAWHMSAVSGAATKHYFLFQQAFVASRRWWTFRAGEKRRRRSFSTDALLTWVYGLHCRLQWGSAADRTFVILFSSAPPVLLLQGTRTPQSDSLSNREAQQRQSLLPLEDTEPQASLTSANLNQPQRSPTPAPLTLVLGSVCEASPACPRTPAAAAAASTSWCCKGGKTRCKQPPAFDSQFRGLSAPFMSFISDIVKVSFVS